MIRDESQGETIQQRLKAIREGLKEGVRREVDRLEELGLPICVVENGKIVVLNPGRRDS
jgi:hypothetical protein